MAIKTDEEMDAELEQLLKEMQEEGEAIARGEDPFQEEEENNDANNDNDGGSGEETETTEAKEEAGEADSTGDEEGGESGEEVQKSRNGDEGDSADNKSDKAGEGTGSGEFQAFEVDYGGTKLSIDSQEEMVALITKGLNSKEPNRPTAEQDMIKQGNLNTEHLQLVIEAINGNSGALAKIAEMGKIDLLDVDANTAKNYQQSFQVQQIDHDLDAIANSIVGDAELFKTWENVTGLADDEFTQTIMSDAQTLKSFKNHMQTGLAEAVMPMAIKRAKITGESLFDAYATVGRDYTDSLDKAKQNTQTEVKEEKKEEKGEERQMSDREKKLREQAGSGASSKETDGEPKDGDDIWDMSDEEFQKKFG